MPELPEVESVVRSLAGIVGRRIQNAEFLHPRVLRGADPLEMARQLSGRTIERIERRGKHIVIYLRRNGYFLVHLGMTGRLLLDASPTKHTRALFTLDRGAILFDDPRMFGRLEWSAAIPDRLGRLGPEPLEISFEEFFGKLKTRRTRIKALLLDQTFVRGMGNIYADEALHRAGVHPQKIAATLRQDRAYKVYDGMRAVLTEAISAGGSSISDYVDAEGRKGWFQIEHRVYQKTGEPCRTCGALIKRILVAQRSTHFCSKCQRR